MAKRFRVRGGKKLDAFIKRLNTARGVKGVEAGFYSTAKYDDGTPVTNVAAYNELGTENKDGTQRIPERPFFRQAIKRMPDPILDVLEQGVDPETMVCGPITAGRVGLVMQSEIQESIVRLRNPPNAPSTILRKGSSNPLVDESVMRRAVTFKVQT